MLAGSAFGEAWLARLPLEFPARPFSSLVTSGWWATPGGTLCGAVDESPLSDANYITSPDLALSPVVAFGLDQVLETGNHVVHVRAKRAAATGQIRAVLLDASDAVQGTSGWQALTATFATYDLAITTTGDATRVRLEVQA